MQGAEARNEGGGTAGCSSPRCLARLASATLAHRQVAVGSIGKRHPETTGYSVPGMPLAVCMHRVTQCTASPTARDKGPPNRPCSMRCRFRSTCIARSAGTAGHVDRPSFASSMARVQSLQPRGQPNDVRADVVHSSRLSAAALACTRRRIQCGAWRSQAARCRAAHGARRPSALVHKASIRTCTARVASGVHFTCSATTSQ